MTLVADIGVDLRLCRARLEAVAARALDVGGVVLGMDAGFHGKLQVSGDRSQVVGCQTHITDTCHLPPITRSGI